MSIYKRKGSPYYWVKFQFQGQEYRRSSRSTSRPEAHTFERRLRQELETQYRSGQVRYTFSEALLTYLEEVLPTKKPETIKRYITSCNNIRDFFDDKYLDEIKRKTISDFIGDRKRLGAGNASMRHDLAVLSAILKMCVTKDWIEHNPVRDFDKREAIPKPKDRVRFLTKEEEAKLFEKLFPSILPIARFALHTGMRISEILNLKHAEVDTERREVFLADTKNNRPRIIPLSDLAWVHYRAQSRHIESPYVFFKKGKRQIDREDGRQLKRGTVSKDFGTCVKLAKIKDFRFHDLRHTFATRYLQNGGKIERLQMILGHSTLEQTRKYAHVVTDDLHEDLRAVGTKSGTHPRDKVHKKAM